MLLASLNRRKRRVLQVKWCEAVRIAEQVQTLRERPTFLRYADVTHPVHLMRATCHIPLIVFNLISQILCDAARIA